MAEEIRSYADMVLMNINHPCKGNKREGGDGKRI